jgi:aspartate/methionine/tyrosine aminotransferase
MQPFINTTTQTVGAYASKTISGRAKSDPSIANLAIGEPDFGPPEHLAETIRAHHLNYPSFMNAVKGYEQSRGLRELRCAISQWYLSRYNYRVDPDTELLITHGGVEAIALAILCTSDPGDTILITDPTYMLYARSIQTLARTAVALIRTPDSEYLGMIADSDKTADTQLSRARALLVNSPENPTGYVIGQDEWQALATYAEARNLWIVHDEVYDTMSLARPHQPARCIDGLADRAILVNSFSKKFGIPGLRIGWLCAKPELISVAAKLHDYLYLGVNVLFEHIALTLISDPTSKPWLDDQAKMLRERAANTTNSLTTREGFSWERRPLGGMFAFPNIEGMARMIPRRYLEQHRHRGDAVAEFLIEQQKVAVVPGSIYGSQGNDSIRLVLSCGDATLQTAVARLTTVCQSALAAGLTF